MRGSSPRRRELSLTGGTDEHTGLYSSDREWNHYWNNLLGGVFSRTEAPVRLTDKQLSAYIGRHSRLCLDDLKKALKRDGYRVTYSRFLVACVLWCEHPDSRKSK